MSASSLRHSFAGASFPPVHRRRAAVVIASLVLGASVWLWQQESASFTSRLVYAEKLPDGRVFRCFSDGAAIGAAGTDVDVRPSPDGGDGSSRSPALVIRPPDRSEDEARQAAGDYQRAGRSPERDLADFDRLAAECRRRR